MSLFQASNPPTKSIGGRFKDWVKSVSNIARVKFDIAGVKIADEASYITTTSNFARLLKSARSEDGETTNADSIALDVILSLVKILGSRQTISSPLMRSVSNSARVRMSNSKIFLPSEQ